MKLDESAVQFEKSYNLLKQALCPGTFVQFHTPVAMEDLQDCNARKGLTLLTRRVGASNSKSEKYGAVPNQDSWHDFHVSLHPLLMLGMRRMTELCMLFSGPVGGKKTVSRCSIKSGNSKSFFANQEVSILKESFCTLGYIGALSTVL